MTARVRQFLFSLLLLVSGSALASEQEVTTLMEDYWRAYSRSEFVEAAGYLDPRDLEALRKGLLPLFMKAADSKNVNVVPLVKSFFGDIPEDEREDMTAPQVFAGLNRMLRHVMPDVYRSLRKTTIDVTEVGFAPDGSAVVRYDVNSPAGEGVNIERANRHEGKWYLRTNETPEATVEQFRMLLGLAPGDQEEADPP
jgi:hypothetical protein